jgi:trans-aconitate methyltransferase
MSLNAASKWNPENYAENASFVPALGNAVLALLDPKPGERILDLGCGDGVLTEKLVAAGAKVVGVDASAEMITAAKARGLDAHVVDGQALTFNAEFDAVFSNAALHWMLNPEPVVAGVYRALKPGGRFVAECGGFGNIAAIRTGIRAVLALHGYSLPEKDSQFYPTAEQYAGLLDAAGFTRIEAKIIPRPTPLPTGMVGWLKTFRQGFLDTMNVPSEKQPALWQEISDFLKPSLCDTQGNWVADYVRLRFSAYKPA